MKTSYLTKIGTILEFIDLWTDNITNYEGEKFDIVHVNAQVTAQVLSH